MSDDDLFLNADATAAECTRLGIPTTNRAALRMMAEDGFPRTMIRGRCFVLRSKLHDWLNGKRSRSAA